MPPDSPYTQYWRVEQDAEQARANTLQWSALVSMRSAADAGVYRADRATRVQNWWSYLRYLYEHGIASEFIGVSPVPSDDGREEVSA